MADEVQYGPNPWQKGRRNDPDVQQSVQEDTGYTNNTRPSMPAAAPAAPEPQPTYNSGVRFPEQGVIVNPETGQAFDIEPGPMRPEGRSGAVDPEERQLYTADAIERQNQYDREYQDYVNTSNDPLDSSYYTQVVEEVNTDPVVELTPYDVSKMLPLSMKNKTDRKSFVLSNYPRLYEAALASGMNENEVYDVVNFTLAVDAAKRIGFTSNPARQRDLLSSMPAPQAGLVIDILNAWATGQQEQQVTPETAAEVANINSTSQVTGSQESKAAAQAIEPENILLRGGKLFWNATIGPTFDFLWMLTEGSMRVANTALLSGSGGSYGDLGPGQGDGGFWGDWSSAWEATDKGSYDPLMVYQLKNKYGAKPVDLLLTIKRMQIEGEDDIYSTILDRYADDQEMLNLIEQAMVRSEQPDWMRSLDNELDAAETSNLGNTIAWGLLSGFGVNPTDPETLETVGGNDLFQSTTKVFNATGAVALDPTVGVGGISKIVNGYKAARYSLAKMANGGPQTVFKYRAVRNHYNYLGAEFDKIRALDNTVDQANALDRLAAQNRKWYDYNALRTLYDSGIKNADDAYNFYTSIDALPTLLTGQAAKRPWEWTVPHTTKATAVAKAAAMKVRSLNPGTMNARQKVDEVFGAGTSELMPEDVAREIIRVIDEDPQKAGQLLSDIAYDATDGAVRTLAGRVVDRVAGVEKRGKWYDRYGWRKRGAATAEPGRVADRLGRLFAIMPDTSGGISVTDASGAELIKRYAQALNLDRSVANTLKFLWGELDVPSRIQLVNGLNRTAIYTTGMHLVDPQWADEFADMFSVATNPNVAYSAQMRDVVGARARAAQIVKQREEARLNPTRRDYDALSDADQAIPTPLTKEQLRDEEMRVFKQLLAEEPAYNPAVIGDTAYAINDTQLTDTVALLNTQELMNYSAKSSFLNTLLFTGRRSSAVTDWWVLATLAGPRFVLRSGMEDAFLYALTDGSPRLYQTGRRVDRALRESSMRVPTKPNEKPRGKKLGVVPTATRRAADRFPILRGFFLDSLDDAAVKEAADAAVKNKDRSKLANLFAFGVARQRLLYHPNEWVRRLANWRYNKEINPTGYSNETVLSWLQDGVERGYLPHIIDDASETSRHLADGTFPAADDMLDTSVVEGVTIRHVPFRREPQKMRSDGTRYYTSDEPWKRNPRDMEAWYRELGDVLHYDGYKGQASIALSRRYYEAKVHLERTGDRSKLDEIIDSYTEILDRDPRIGEYVIAQDRGTRYLAEAKLEHALRLMTTANGKFNFPLFNKMRYKTVLDDGTEVTSYGLWRFEEGSDGLPAAQRPREYLVSQQDLASKDIPAPQSVRVIEDIQVPVSDKMPLSGQAWSTMGRALARLTRGPLASANFISARAAIEPFRLKMEAKVGKEAADEWAAKTAADRGLAMTMAYVDNPAIRSQFAWNVRNVARFYRALEDFYRRMMRVTTNKPETFWKIGLGWNILDDSGFVWEDEYGEKYFLFPGTNMAFNAVNGVARNVFGVQPVVPDLPVAYGSKVTMIMPSADPDQAVLTLGGPMGAFALKPLLRRFDLLTGLEPQLYGEYSAGQPLVSTLIQDALGPNIRRLMDVAFAMGGDQESRFAEAETAYAAAAKKSIQAVAAAGIYDPTKDYTAEEMREIEAITDAASINALWLQLMLSPTLFTTPRLLPDDVTMLSREIGLDSLNAQFLEVVQNSENFDEAFVKYTRQNPGKAIFTISKYERTYNYEPIVETENFIKKYQDEFDQRPQGMSFFSPTEGTYGGLKTFSFLRANGLKPSKTVENFWKETLGITGKQIYYAERAKYETELAAATTAEDRRILNRAWAIRRDEIYRDYPDTEAAVEGSLRTSEQMSSSEYVDIIEEIRGSALFFAKQPETKERASEVLNVFETYDSARNDFERNQRTNPNYAEDNTINKNAWKSLVDQWGAEFAEDDRMLRLIRLMSAALDVEVEI